jgi:hypothetical protein
VGDVLHTLRGTGSSKKEPGIVVCEEIAYMDIRLLYNVVLPTLARAGIAFIGISTLADPFNFWTQMLELKNDDGREVFKTLRYTLVCEECARVGKEDTCKHKLGDLPYWQDASQHKKLEAIMQDKHDSYIRETKYVSFCHVLWCSVFLFACLCVEYERSKRRAFVGKRG